MIEAKQKTIEETTAFRDIRIEVSETDLIMRLGDYTVHIDRRGSSFCSCPSGTLGGTSEPLVFHQDEENGSRKPCKHIRAAWALSPLLWSLGASERVSDEPLVRTFWSEYDRQNEQETKKAIAKGIEHAIQTAELRSRHAYLEGEREFSTDLIADLEVPEARTQRWKASVAKRLVSLELWQMTDRTKNSDRPASGHSIIRVYAAGPRLIRDCDKIEKERRS